MAELSIHSQINTTSSGLTTSSGWVTAGFSPNGWFADGIGAMRFQLPVDFSGSETIHSATLHINASANGGSGSWCKTWIGIIAGAQTLPADYMGLSSASTRAPRRIIGGYTSDDVDATVGGSQTVINLSLTDAFLAAQSDGALGSGYVVILYYPHSNNGGASHQIDGIGNSIPATLTLLYADPGPPLENNAIAAVGVTRTAGDQVAATYQTTAAVATGATRTAAAAVATGYSVSVPAIAVSATRTAGDAIAITQGLLADIATGVTRTAGDAIAATADYPATNRHHGVFPDGLFPQGLFT